MTISDFQTTGFMQAIRVRPRGAIAVLASVIVLAACAQQPSDSANAVEEAHAAPSSSSAGLPAGGVAAGEKAALAKGAATGQSCVDCHGADGNVPIDPSYPKLGGQYADYLAHALQAYRKGDREHVLMSSQAKGLTDQQIADLAVYFASREGQLTDLKGAYKK